MNALITTVLDCPPALVWNEVKTSRLLHEIMAPLVRIAPAESAGIPESWSAGIGVRIRPLLLWFIPMGIRMLRFERVDEAAREIQTREHDPICQQWDHLISVQSAPGNRTEYADQVSISAGLLTPVVWLFAQIFYRHRQRKWKRVVARLKAAV